MEITAAVMIITILNEIFVDVLQSNKAVCSATNKEKQYCSTPRSKLHKYNQKYKYYTKYKYKLMIHKKCRYTVTQVQVQGQKAQQCLSLGEEKEKVLIKVRSSATERMEFK